MTNESIFDDLEYYREYVLEPGETDLRSYLLDAEDLADKIASGHYPTLPVLAEMQRSLGQAPRDPDAKDVEPFPPRRRKEEIFDAAKYTAMDEYVKILLPELRESEESFARRLFSMSSSNLGRVRAAFYFVSTASVNGMSKVEGESAVYRLIRKLRRSGGAAVAFQRLLELSGVPGKRISGYKKGATWQNGFAAPHDRCGWLACYVEGEWRFVDAIWGSRAVQGFDTGIFAKVDAAGNVETARKSEGIDRYECDEFFFLTDPEKLILTHFPDEHLSQWQLLVRPITLAEFNKMPALFSKCFNWMENRCVVPQSHPLNVIVAGPGTVEIFLAEARGKDLEYETEIRIHAKSLNDESRAAIKEQSDVKGYLSKMTRMSKTEVKFKFVPPCRGKFMLSIFLVKTVHYFKKLVSSTVELLSYVIHCPQAVRNARTVPQGSEKLLGFGAGRALAEADLLTDEPGEMKATDGERKLVLESGSSKNRILECRLMGAANEILPSSNLLTWTAGSKVNIVFLSPDSGSYALVVQERGQPLCQFLIDAPSECRDGHFRMPDLQKLGGLGVTDSDLSDVIHPVSHPEPYLVCEESSLELKFSTTIPVEAKAELVYIDSDGGEVALDGFAFVSNSEQGFSADVRFQLAGHYVIRLHARLGTSSLWRHYRNYFVRCLGQLDGSAEEFPEVGEAWDSRNLLIEPRQRLLPVNEAVQFSLQISDPAVSAVCVVGKAESACTTLVKSNSGLWQGCVQADNESAGSEVEVVAQSDAGKCMEFLRYRFGSAQDLTALELAMQEARELNRRRELCERARVRKQENHERRDRAEELLPEDPVVPAMERWEEADGPDAAALADWLNRALDGDADCQRYLPFQPDGSDVWGKCRDGIALCKVINTVSPGTIDERALSRSEQLTQQESEQNVTLALNSVQSLGLPVSLEAAELTSGSQDLIQGLLWQIIRLGLLANAKRAAAACGSELVGLAPDQMLMQWVNKQLEKVGCQLRISNFSDHIRDSEVYARLLQQIVPRERQSDFRSASEILQHSDLLLRAQQVLYNAQLVDARQFVQPASIVSGNPDLNMAFVANLFSKFPCLPQSRAKVPVHWSPPADRSREEKSYINWMNSIGVQPRVNNLETDLRSGLIYLQLLNLIQPGVVPWSGVHKTFHRMRKNFQQLENCNRALELGRELGFTLVGIGGEDLLSGNEVLTLGLLWQLMRAHTLAALSQAAAAVGSVGKSEEIDEKSIIDWANETLLAGGKKSRLSSFQDPAISDARCLLDLIDCLRPGSVDYGIVLAGSTESEKLQNAKLAISLGWRAGARIRATPEDIVEVKSKMLMTTFACLMQLHFQLHMDLPV